MKQLIFFTANWCPSCQSMKPTIETVSKRLKTPMASIDTDYDSSNVEKYGIKSIPTLILLENGAEIKRLVGAQSENKLIEFING